MSFRGQFDLLPVLLTGVGSSSVFSNSVPTGRLQTIGKGTGKRKIKLIYGGGNMGLMGKVADGAMEEWRSFVTGIIPNFLAKLEVAHKTLSELHFVETMHERKAKMVSMSDGVIAMPGGMALLTRLFEILTWSQLKIFAGPVGLLNVNGFYDLLLLQLDKMIEEELSAPENRLLLVVAEDPADAP